MSELTELTIAEARDGLVNRKFSSVELTDVHIRAVEAARDLNAFVTETLDLAIERAKASDDRRAVLRPPWPPIFPSELQARIQVDLSDSQPHSAVSLE